MSRSQRAPLWGGSLGKQRESAQLGRIRARELDSQHFGTDWPGARGGPEPCPAASWPVREASLSSSSPGERGSSQVAEVELTPASPQQYLYVADLARKDKRVLRKKYQIYFW